MDETMILRKQKFYESIEKREYKNNSAILSNEKYLNLISDVKNMKIKKTQTCDYWLAKHYDLITINGVETLIYPFNENNPNFKIYVMTGDMFDILSNVHKSIGYGGRDRMLFELNKKYKNITQADVKLYLNLCIPCQQKKKSQKKGIVVKPMVFNDFKSRCQIDLIDFQSQPDRDFKFICVYQDHLTKYCILKPLTSKRAERDACVF